MIYDVYILRTYIHTYYYVISSPTTRITHTPIVHMHKLCCCDKVLLLTATCVIGGGQFFLAYAYYICLCGCDRLAWPLVLFCMLILVDRDRDHYTTKRSHLSPLPLHPPLADAGHDDDNKAWALSTNREREGERERELGLGSG